MPYQITAEDIRAFTYGDCWALARELHQRTGWQVCALGAYRFDTLASQAVYDYPLVDFDWMHMLVETPDQRYLDVTGFVTVEQLTATYLPNFRAAYGWAAQELIFEPVIGETDWAALTGVPKRDYPSAPVKKVAAELLRRYRLAHLDINHPRR